MYNNKQAAGGIPSHPRKDPKYPEPISLAYLKKIYADCEDFQSREVFPGLDGTKKITVCWIDGLVSGDAISEDVLRPLTDDRRFEKPFGGAELMELILSGAVYSCSVRRRAEMDKVVTDLANGFCAIIFDSVSEALSFEVKSTIQRSVEKPEGEKTVKGSKDSFVETMRMNTCLVRKKLRTPELKSLSTTIGRESGTAAVVMYVDGVCKEGVVGELMRRLDGIDIDGLLATGDFEDYVADDPDSPFPQVVFTERPDKFAMSLLDGQVGVIIDGLPFGFLLPATFASFMRVPDDESQNFLVASALRLVRYLSMLISLTLPALLVASVMYHPEIIPTELLESFIEAKQKVPFTVAAEVLAMLIAFELLQEAGLRLPDPVGQTVSIIGALIVGQSAIGARLVSPIPVIVVAMAGIAGFVMPNRDIGSALRLFRFLLVIAAAAMGLYGVVCGIVLVIWHLSTLESFGVAYTSPFTDSVHGGLWRTMLRSPMRDDKLRDAPMSGPNRRRQA